METILNHSALSTHEVDLTIPALRETLGCFPTGVAVATTLATDGTPTGLTINSFSSVSMDPPLILWSLANTAPSFDAFMTHGAFTINILDSDQDQLCCQFSKPSLDKFSGVKWHAGHKGTPVLDDVLVTLECDTYHTVEGGDHEVFLGQVKRMGRREAQPLVFYRGQLVTLAS